MEEDEIGPEIGRIILKKPWGSLGGWWQTMIWDVCLVTADCKTCNSNRYIYIQMAVSIVIMIELDLCIDHNYSMIIIITCIIFMLSVHVVFNVELYGDDKVYNYKLAQEA